MKSMLYVTCHVQAKLQKEVLMPAYSLKFIGGLDKKEVETRYGVILNPHMVQITMPEKNIKMNRNIKNLINIACNNEKTSSQNTTESGFCTGICCNQSMPGN